ncbi:unnamed protein product, partial [Mesorhabditis spiculigera]
MHSAPGQRRPARSGVPMIQPPQQIDDSYTRYVDPQYLGKGGFATVWLYRDDYKKQPYAIKIIAKAQLSRDSSVAKLHREIQLQSRCSHPNIVRYYHDMEDEQFHYLVLEYCKNGTLQQRIHRSQFRRLTSFEACTYLSGVIEAVLYLFEIHLLHRDLKPANVFLCDDRNIKLGDFGLAIDSLGPPSRSISGTPNYLAPEVLRRRGHSEHSEAWAIGCTLFCMLTGRPPFETPQLDCTYARIMKADYTWPQFDDGGPPIERSAMALVSGLLTIDPSSRMTVDGIRESLFYRINHQHPDERPPLTINCELETPPAYQPSWPTPSPSPPSLNEPCYSPPEQQRIKVNGWDILRPTSQKWRPEKHSAQDSGVGSYPDLITPRPAWITRLQSYQNELTMIVQSHHRLVEIMPEAVLHVSRWVDYTNRQGFAFLLSDGSCSVNFCDGNYLALSPSSLIVRYGSDTFGESRTLSTYQAPPEIVEKARLAGEYRKYMMHNLAQAVDQGIWDRLGGPMSNQLPYVQDVWKSPTAVVFLLSNGAVQVNFMERHCKIIISPPTGYQPLMAVTVIEPNRAIRSYRVETRRPEPNAWRAMGPLIPLLAEMGPLMGDQLVRVRFPQPPASRAYPGLLNRIPRPLYA